MGFGDGFITTVLEITADPSKAINAVERLRSSNDRAADGLRNNFVPAANATGKAMERANESGVLGFHSLRERIIETTKSVAALRNALLVAHDPSEIKKLNAELADETAKLRAVRTELRGVRMGSMEAYEGLQGVGDMIGHRIPYGVSTLISRMPAAQQALSKVFSIEMLGIFGAAVAEAGAKVIEWIGKEAEAWGGYTEAVKKAREADIHASNEALTHFATIAEGRRLIADTNRELADLDAKHSSMAPAVQAATEKMRAGWLDLLGPIGAAKKMVDAYNAAQGAVVGTANQTAETRERLIEQLRRMAELQEKGARGENDALAQLLQRTRENVEAMQSGELPARQRINLEIQRQIDSADREIKKDRELYAQKKLTNEELSRAEKEYTETLTALSTERQLKLQEEANKVHATAAAHADILAEQLQRVRENVAVLASIEVPARQRIELEYQHQMDAAKREIESDRELYSRKKLTKTELDRDEREYTALVETLADERAVKLAQEADKEWAAIKKVAEAMKFQIPAGNANAFKPMVDAVKQLDAAQRAALPTEREITLIRTQLQRLMPDITRDELNHKVQLLALNPAMIQVLRSTVDRKNASQQLQAEIRKELQLNNDLTQAEVQLSQTATGMVVVAIKQMTAAMQAGESAAKAFGDAMKQASQMSQQSAMAAIQANLEYIGDYILGRKLMAEIEGGVEVAKAIAAFALRDFWGGAEHLTAAAKWAIVARQAGGSVNVGSAGAGGGYASPSQDSGGRAPGSSGPQSAGAMGSPNPLGPGLTSMGSSGGGPSYSGNLKVMILTESQAGQEMASVLTNHVLRGGGQLVASRSVSPSRAGR